MNDTITGQNLPELRVTKNGNIIEVHILNTSPESLSEILCGTVESVVANGQCAPDSIVLAVTTGISKCKMPIKIAHLAGLKGVRERIASVAAKIVIGLSMIGAITYGMQSNWLMATLMGAICLCFVLAEL